MKHLLFSLFTVLFFHNIVSACSYSGSPNVPYGYFIAKTNIILLAEVAEKTTVFKNQDGQRYPVHYYKINIVETIKGKDKIKRKSFRFHFSELRQSSCDTSPPKMKIGEKWIIFGDYDEGKDGFQRYLRGDINNMWINYSKTPRELDEIKKLVKSPQTTIQGEINKTGNGGFTSMPAENIEVLIEGEKFRSKTKTDDEGRYIFSGIPAGKYKITINLNYRAFDIMERQNINNPAVNTVFAYEETIREGDSEYRYFDFQKYPIEN